MVRHQSVAAYSSWVQLLTAAESDDADAKRLRDLIYTYCGGIVESLRGLRRLLAARPEEADIRFSMAHRAKGLEADTVVDLDDFKCPRALLDSFLRNAKQSANWELEYNQEINLLYVAVTRARSQLFLPDELFND